jgi:hypothetical protein
LRTPGPEALPYTTKGKEIILTLLPSIGFQLLSMWQFQFPACIRLPQNDFNNAIFKEEIAVPSSISEEGNTHFNKMLAQLKVSAETRR